MERSEEVQPRGRASKGMNGAKGIGSEKRKRHGFKVLFLA